MSKAEHELLMALAHAVFQIAHIVGTEAHRDFVEMKIADVRKEAQAAAASDQEDFSGDEQP